MSDGSSSVHDEDVCYCSSELKEVDSGLSKSTSTLHKCLIAVAFLEKVSPIAIEAARVLSSK